MFENYEEKAFSFLKEFRRITPFLIMRRFHLKYDAALKICCKVWLRQHLEARKLTKEWENDCKK